MSSIQSRLVDPLSDGPELVDLFDLVFGHTVTPEMWAWKYVPPWVDRHYCWVGTYEGRIIGYVGAVPQRGWIDGAEVPFFQLADMMVHPEHRLVHDYFSLAPKVIMDDLGSAHARHLLYGFSGHRAFRWYERAGLSGLVERARTRYVRPGAVASSGRYEVRDWDWDASEIDDVWGTWRDRIRAGLIRDREYLGWRYGDHPINRYRLLGVYEEDTVSGWVVIGNDGPGKGRSPEVPVVDALLPEEVVEDALASLAEQLDRPLQVWLPTRRFPAFAEEKDAGTYVYHFVKGSAVETEFLRDNLYYTMGDVDWW